MIKKLLLLLTISAFLLTVSATAMAQKPTDDSLPQSPGIYSVPGHSKLKLRVFVHNARGNHAKPGPSPTPSLKCSLADPGSSTVDGVTGWHLPSGTWTYRLNTSSAPGLIGGTNLGTLTGNAFSAWSATDVGSKVSFSRGSNTTTKTANYDGQNIISWGHTSGQALATTYTWYYTSNGQVAEVDTIFNSRFSWEWAGGGTNCAYQGYYDAQDILTHELGHWMGLDDNYDSSYTNNTMFGYGDVTEVKKNTLSSGDTTAVNSLY